MHNLPGSKIIRSLLQFCLGAVLFIALLGVISLVKTDSISASTSLANTTPSKIMNPIAELQLALKSPSLEPTTRSFMESKLYLYQREATQNAQTPVDSGQLLSEKQTVIAQATTSPSVSLSNQDMVRPTGIFTDPMSRDITRDALFSTVWIQPFGNTYVQVFSGHMINDKEQGVLYLMVERPYHLTKFLVPGKTGNLTIVGLNETVLTLINGTGIKYYFDWQKQTVMDSSKKVLLIVTPNPLPGYPNP
jgi:hypothetical protein